jgi:hypothetical protein
MCMVMINNGHSLLDARRIRQNLHDICDFHNEFSAHHILHENYRRKKINLYLNFINIKKLFISWGYSNKPYLLYVYEQSSKEKSFKKCCYPFNF